MNNEDYLRNLSCQTMSPEPQLVMHDPWIRVCPQRYVLTIFDLCFQHPDGGQSLSLTERTVVRACENKHVSPVNKQCFKYMNIMWAPEYDV